MISVKGNVLKSPDPNDTSKTLLISDGRHVISVNFGSIDEIPHDLSVNSKIKATGIAVLDAELWRSGRAQPRIHGYTVVLRRPDDITVISRPPWWTPGRMMVIIGILVLVLLFILIWIRILNRLVERRGRELFKSGDQIPSSGAVQEAQCLESHRSSIHRNETTPARRLILYHKMRKFI